MGAPGRNAALEILRPASLSAAGTDDRLRRDLRRRRSQRSRGGDPTGPRRSQDSGPRTPLDDWRRRNHRRAVSRLPSLDAGSCRAAGCVRRSRASARRSRSRDDRSRSVCLRAASGRAKPGSESGFAGVISAAFSSFRNRMRAATPSFRSDDDPHRANLCPRSWQSRLPRSNSRRAATSGHCCGMARRLRRLGKRDAYRLLRWTPMSAGRLRV